MTIRQPASPEPPSWLYGSGGQLRAVWRIGVFVCVFFLINGILESVATPAITFLSANTGNLFAARELVDCLSALATIALVLRQVDKQEWQAVAMQANAWRARFLAQGLVLGGTAIVATSLILLAFGQMSFAPDTLSSLLNGNAAPQSATQLWFTSSLRISLLLAPAALFEELLFRGYLWRVVDDAGGARRALIVTSVVFGLVHLQNPGVNKLAIGNVMLAGVALGLVRLRTNSLPAAWTAHFAWNWVMAAALHVEVSGLPIATPGYRAVLAGPEWFAGGEWGPEGGVAASVVLLATIALGMYPTMFPTPLSNLSGRAQNATQARSQ